jgi:hypothetical protein
MAHVESLQMPTMLADRTDGGRHLSRSGQMAQLGDTHTGITGQALTPATATRRVFGGQALARLAAANSQFTRFSIQVSQ